LIVLAVFAQLVKLPAVMWPNLAAQSVRRWVGAAAVSGGDKGTREL
jgi:hypothetical protein